MFAGTHGYQKIVKRVLWCALIFSGLFLWAANTLAIDYGFTLDFEEGDLRGWQISGNAFQNQPTLEDNPTIRGRGQPSQHQGRYWIGTFENYQGKRDQKAGGVQGDAPTGVLTSKRFTIPKGNLSFLLGGGSDAQRLGVTLWIKVRQTPEFDSDRVYHAAGGNSESMRRVTWDLTPYAGREGFIQIVDNSTGEWGHINVDDFRFSADSTYSGATRPPSTIPPTGMTVAETRVPSLVGRTIVEAEELLATARLSLGRVDKRESGRRAGTVLSQSLKAGTLASLKTTVSLVIAINEYVTVPLLIGKNIGVAEEQLSTKDLRIGRIIRTRSPEISGIVLEQKPFAKERVPKGTAVDLVVAEAEVIAVPDLVGRPLEEAEELLGALRLKRGNIQERESSQRERAVISQRPAAGKEVQTGSPVDLVIAIPITVSVPYLIGLNLERAQAILEKAGLRTGPLEGRTVARPAGTVLGQKPEAGARVLQGSPVRIMVAEGVSLAIIPDLVGLPLNKATRVLRERNLSVGKITRAGSERPPDTVLKQSPQAGSSIRVGLTVNVSVAEEKSQAGTTWIIVSASVLGMAAMGGFLLRQIKQRTLRGTDADFSVTIRKDPGRQTILTEKPLFQTGKLRIRAVADKGISRSQTREKLFKNPPENGENL
jgi:beta-lactam-binding protein with PASTA domain